MKKSSTIFLLIITFFLIIYGCKKDEDSHEEPECSNTSFFSTFDIEFDPKYIEEDSEGNIYVLGRSDSIISVLKVNDIGEKLWFKKYDELTGLEQGLVIIDENSFFVKTSTSQYKYEDPVIVGDIWIKNGFILDSGNNYIPTYELTGTIQPKLRTEYTNLTTLNKISSEGELLLTKEFDGDACNGNSFYKIDNDNFLMLTSEFYGPYFEFIIYDGHIDTIDHPNDENNRTVYKINNNGDIIWETEIENIFNVSFEAPMVKFFQQSITQNNDRIYVNTLNNTFELSLTGEILTSFQPKYNFQANWTYFMEKVNSTDNVFFGNVFDQQSKYNYLLKYNSELNEIEWERTQFSDVIQISTNSNREEIFVHGYDDTHRFIKKYNDQGELVWHQIVYCNIIKSACNGGMIFAKEDSSSDKITVVKTDEDGNYPK